MSAKKSLLLPVDAYDLTAKDEQRIKAERALGFLPAHDARLSQPAQAVGQAKIGSPRIQKLIARMLELCGSQRTGEHANTRKGHGLVGLAAPQIGEAVQIILVDTQIGTSRQGLGKLECFINPKIIWQSRETNEGREGCFSTSLVWGIVRRPIAVKIRAYTQDGQEVERILEDFTARIALHELDHLQGIRFPDRIRSPRKLHWVHADELNAYPAHCKQWHRLYAHAQWEALKKSK